MPNFKAMKKLIFILTFLSVSLMVLAQEPRTRTKRDTSASETVRVPRETLAPEIILSHTTLELFEKEDEFSINARTKNVRADNPPIIWTSSKPAIASVDAKGKVKPLASGKTLIKATLQGTISAQCEVIVSKANYWGNSSAALADGGYVASQNDWIFYANPYDSLKLYKININGDGKSKLSDDKPNYINVIGRYVYYQNTNDKTKMGLYKIGIDGTQRTLINDLDIVSYLQLTEYDFAIYLNQDMEVYRLYYNRPDKPKVKYFDEKDEITSIAFDEYYVYYTKWWEKMKQAEGQKGGLYFYDIKEKKTERLINSNNIITKFTLGNDGWIYYSQDGSNTVSVDVFTGKGEGDPVPIGFYRGKMAKYPGHDKKILIPDQIHKGDLYAYWTVYNDWIYYIEFNSSPVLRRMQTDGKKDQKVTDIPDLISFFGIYQTNNHLLLLYENKLLRMLKDGRNAVELN